MIRMQRVGRQRSVATCPPSIATFTNVALAMVGHASLCPAYEFGHLCNLSLGGSVFATPNCRSEMDRIADMLQICETTRSTRCRHSPALGRCTQKCSIELARAEEIDEGELPDHQASGGQKQTAPTMIDLNYSAKPMKPIHVHVSNVRPRYEERIVRPSDVQAGSVNPRLPL